MDKPVSISVKAFIIRNMSVRSMVQENIIETVVNHQFESALEAMNTCDSLEFSGFGKLFFNRKKAIKKLQKFADHIDYLHTILDNPSTSEIKRRNTQLRIESLVKNFNYLNDKLNGRKTDIRGMEKQPVSSEALKEADSTGEEGEDADMQ